MCVTTHVRVTQGVILSQLASAICCVNCGSRLFHHLDSLERVRPLMVVRHLPPSSRCIIRGSSPRPSVLARRVGPRLGRESHQQLRRWLIEEREFLINLRELCAIRMALYHFRHSTWGLSYIKKRGGGGGSVFCRVQP